MTRIAALTFAFLSLMIPPSSAKEKSMLTPDIRVGSQAPEFELKDATGTVHRLSEFRGKKTVVLFFYPKDNTPGCTAQACEFRDQHDVFAEAGAQVIGVSSDTVESHQGFAKKYDLPFLLLSDPAGKTRRAYRVPSTLGIMPGRVTYVIDREGVIQMIFSSQLKPKQHAEEALKVIRKLR